MDQESLYIQPPSDTLVDVNHNGLRVRHPPLEIEGHVLPRPPSEMDPNMIYPPPRVVKGLTFSERWEMFTEGKRWKQIRPYLNPLPVFVILLLTWSVFVLSDFQIIENAEAYSIATRCHHPLVLLKDSTLRSHVLVEDVQLSPIDYELLNDVLATSACYLTNYADQMSCITPLAYGKDLRIISMRRKNGNIVHLINPKNPTKLGTSATVPESISFLPGVRFVNVSRPVFMNIEYVDSDFKSTRNDRFELGDAFCIGSSLDLFDHIIHQIGNEQEVHKNAKKN